MAQILTEDERQNINQDFFKHLHKTIEDLYSKKRFAEARESLQAARSRFPGNPWILTHLAHCLYLDESLPSEGRKGEALDLLVEMDCAEPGEGDIENRMIRGFSTAFFILKDYTCAGQWIEQVKGGVTAKETAAFARHLIYIAYSQGISLPDSPGGGRHPAWETLSPLIGPDDDAVFSNFTGKVGLALSGGGFRASLYHIGVLARLAEMDVLRSVEVLSTVSGGSIVGALYYLKVKELLETTPDEEITRESYIQIVQTIQDAFLKGIQKNIRIKAFADFLLNCKMIFSDDYSRSHRLGELYESILYSNQNGDDDGSDPPPIYMNDLIIKPVGRKAFKPRSCNWRRRAKVPMLLLNATSLNTGHSWHFTASFMGEPPGLLTVSSGGDTHLEVDKNLRYRRVRYHQAPEGLQQYRLGYAVAASASVPGLFDPLTITGLYPDKTVRLVDGGVHDNQGVAGLQDECCTFIFCSDASGQMGDEDKPSGSVMSTLLRSSSITMDRVREEEYEKLRAQVTGQTLRGLFFIHLKKEFPVSEVDWIGCSAPSGERNREGDLPYGIDLQIQTALSAIRTDLDAFTDVEAFSLMTSGYLMARQESLAIHKRIRSAGHEDKWAGFPIQDASPDESQWSFLGMRHLLTGVTDRPGDQREIKKQLKVAHDRALKVWKLDPVLKWAGFGCIAALVILGYLFIKANWQATLCITLGAVVLPLILVLVPLILNKLLSWLGRRIGARSRIPDMLHRLLKRVTRWISLEKAVKDMARDAAIAFIGSMMAKAHLKFFNKRFLKTGSMKRFKKDGK